MGTISRVTTWSTGDTLSASDLNGEFDNILSTANGSLNADNLGVTAGQASASKAIVLDSNKDFANATGSNQIRNLTLSGSLKIGTTFLPDASGGADLGSTTLEWGDVYVADDKYLYMGSDQNIKIGYDETTTDSLAISAIEGAGLAITLRADEGDDAGDEWKLNVADGGTITLGNDIASAGTFVTHLTLTPHATVSSSTLALAGALTVAGTAGVTGVATVGGLTIGSAVINEADLEQIDDLTAGTVTASKAVVVDSNKDIGTFRNITIDGTFSDGNYTFDTSGNVSGLGTIGSGAITATDTTAPLILKYDAGEYVTHAVSSAGVYSIATTDASSDSGAITLDTVDSITLDSDTASEGIVYADGGTNLLRVSNSSSDVIFKPLVDAKDIVFQQYDGNEVCRIADNRRLYFYDEGGEYISSSGSALTIASGSAAWELPAADGSDGQVLKTDGSGNLDWVTQTSGATLSGSTDNTVVTVTGSNAMQGEANLTFDGSTLVVTGSIDLSADIDVDGTLEADAITLGGTALGSLYSPIAGSSSIVTVGTISTGVWQGTAVASAYLDSDTAHLSTTQTFTGDKTFTGAVQVGDATVASAATAADELVLEGSSTGMTISSSGTTNSGSIFFGDADNNQRGRVQYNHNQDNLILSAAGTEVVNVRTGLVGINETANGKMTQGITIQQGTNDNEILALKSSTDVAQDCTDVAEADTYGTLTKYYATAGGLQVTGFVDSGAQAALSLQGVTSHASPQSGKTSANNGTVNISAYKVSSNDRAQLSADENILSIYGASATRFIFDCDGDAYADSQWTTFDDHDDLAMLHDIEATMIPDLFGKCMKYDAPYLEKVGIIGEGSIRQENGKTRAMINTNRLQMLHHGAIRQVHKQLQDVKEFYEDKIAALETRLLQLEA
tara:strand:- start:434 stop:3142 length:2709 start_codon:yes stop_codon:yes gene_type:complete